MLQDNGYSDYRAQVGQVLQQKDRTGQVSAADRRQVGQMTDGILGD